MNTKVTREVAEQDVNAWLDNKRVRDTQREANKTSVESLIEAVMYGDISIDTKTFTITHTLQCKVEGLFDSLNYKPRITVGDRQKVSSAMKANDVESIILCTVAAISDKSASHIQRMDTEDYKIAQAVAVFFM